ncbi:MAG: UvrD-helicase domain-containing protein [Bacteroidales bacterium]|nr:UvrD-helicase domain-containing protein [Bacteroidales bacterium]
MKILKASAGSGKTYRLSKHYVDLLLKDREPYRHRNILAVTFTNKATAEMKNRILEDLAKLAETSPDARKRLTELLHDYGAFSVSTIDRFFQRALKAFSRELGQFADYQIELDKESLIVETMDRILDSLTEEDRELLEWIRSALEETLSQGDRFFLDAGLKDVGMLLKNDEHRDLVQRFGISDTDAFGKERLGRIRRECRGVIREFTERAAALGFPVERGKIISPKNKLKLIKATPGLPELFEEASYRPYCTAWILDRMLFQLGFAGEFYRAFDALLREKNLMCLDESNTILRDIIGGSDAPFVYEKLGVRYEHFLLDEFQDTSHIQWDNFLPLLKESESHGGSNLLVGDIKQSIYRFRDSDWRLLGEEVGREFPEAREEVMKGNWRSTEEVVDFNHRFFSFASELLGLQKIYAEEKPLVMRKEEKQRGCVRVSFCDDQDAAVVDSVLQAHDAGARWNDIAILVRNKQEGARLAACLIEREIPVISDDSLDLKGSPVVRRLVSLLNHYENPDDSIGSFLARSLEIEYPERYHSLADFCEQLVRSLQERDPGSFEGQLLFVQAFMDVLQDWTRTNGNNLRYFLKSWEEQGSIYIGSPEDAASVRVLTIHKSKGLQFPHVIFPYAEKVGLYKSGTHWCRLDPSATTLKEAAGGIYPVALDSLAEQSDFAEAVRQERRMQLVDNINLFYVAMTRAEKSLHVIAKTSTDKLRKGIQKGSPEPGNFAEILYVFLKGMDETVCGQPYDFTRMKRKEETSEKVFPAAFPSIPPGGRLAPSSDAADFFGPDGATGPDASVRLRGIVLHDILSEVKGPADLDAAVDAAVRDGRLDAAGGESARTLLRERIAAHPGWFPEASGSGVRVVNEQDVFDADGKVERPDRVVVRGREAVIVDYKFGREEESYRRQLRRYARLWHELGYEVRGAYIWYVEDDKTVEVI